MKTLVIILSLVMFAATSAFAVVETRDDNMGLYWDLDGDVSCVASFAGTQNIYLILANPSFDQLYGFEAAWTMVCDSTDPYVLSATFANPEALDVAAGFQNFIVGFGNPTDTSSTDAVLLVTIELGNFGGSTDIKFFLTHAEPPSEGAEVPVLLLANDELVPSGTHTATWSPAAYMGSEECGTVAVEETTWDSVKSLYR